MPTTTTGVATEFINFTRASNATVVDSNGLIDWAAHNLLLASEQFDSASWTKSALTVTANNASAPNGTTTAELAVPNTTSTQHSVAQTVTLETGTSLVAGLFVKASGYSKISLFDNAAGNRWVSYSLSGAGSILASAASATGSITALANGWYFISMAEAAGASAMAFTVFVLDDAYTNASPLSYSYAGNGTSGVLIWGAHLYRSDLGGMQPNTSAYPMYNPTTPKNLLGFTENFDNAAWTKTSATVSADSLSAPNGLNTSDTLTASAGTVFPQVLQATPAYTTAQMVSVYAKAGTYGILQLFNAYGAAHYANFNLSAGVVGTKGASVSDSGMVALGNGWYRCWAYFAALDDVGIGMAGSTSATKQATWATTGSETIYAWGAQLSDSASLYPYVANHFTAPSAAAYYGPRRDFDPVTLACKGLLVEEQRANLLTYSAQFDDAAWSKNGAASITADTTVAPDGTSTSDTLTGASGDPSVGTTDTVSRSPVVSSSTAYTASLYVKGIVGTTIKLLLRDGSTGTVASVTGTLTSSWQRISCTLTSGAATTGFSLRIGGTNGTVAIWGAQLEAGSFATSYIPTTTASATRNGDVAQVSTAAFPYSAAESSIVANCVPMANGNTNIVQLSAANTPFGLLVYQSIASSAAYVDASSTSLGLMTLGAVEKIGIAYNGSSNGAVRNGGTVSSVGTTVSATATKMGIGSGFNGGGTFNGHIRQITYLPRRISNTELQTRTA